MEELKNVRAHIYMGEDSLDTLKERAQTSPSFSQYVRQSALMVDPLAKQGAENILDGLYDVLGDKQLAREMIGIVMARLKGIVTPSNEYEDEPSFLSLPSLSDTVFNTLHLGGQPSGTGIPRTGWDEAVIFCSEHSATVTLMAFQVWNRSRSDLLIF
jgi:hypothetical protein